LKQAYTMMHGQKNLKLCVITLNFINRYNSVINLLYVGNPMF